VQTPNCAPTHLYRFAFGIDTNAQADDALQVASLGRRWITRGRVHDSRRRGGGLGSMARPGRSRLGRCAIGMLCDGRGRTGRKRGRRRLCAIGRLFPGQFPHCGRPSVLRRRRQRRCGFALLMDDRGQRLLRRRGPRRPQRYKRRGRDALHARLDSRVGHRCRTLDHRQRTRVRRQRERRPGHASQERFTQQLHIRN
jgi:hypothetical protein